MIKNIKSSKKLLSFLTTSFLIIGLGCNQNLQAYANDQFNNNPEKEILIDTPSKLPLSDKDNKRQWKLSLTMSDEFDENQLDTTKWLDHHSYWSGRQPSCFDTKNISVKDGKLILTSQWETNPTQSMIDANNKLKDGTPKYENISSSCVQSKVKTGYGYYEIKAKTAPISISSAFWFQNPSSNSIPGQEIDVFEQVGRPANYNLAKNGSDYPMNIHDTRNGIHSQQPTIYNVGYDLTSDYHIYGLEWDENYIRYYIDGDLIHEIDNNSDKKICQPQYVFFDMETLIYGCAAPAKKDFEYKDGERNPANYEIEYFRAWRSDIPQSKDQSVTAVNKVPTPKEAEAIYGSPIINSDSKEIDPIWNTAKEIGPYSYKRGDNSIPISAITKTMWDEDFFYVYNEIIDPDIYKNTTRLSESDNTELYIDSLNEKSKDKYDENDYCIKVFPDGEVSSYGGVPKDIVTNAIITEKGYITQYKIPWTHVTGKKDRVIGFDIQINQAFTNSSARDAIIGWNDTTNNTWKTLVRSGNVRLINDIKPIDKDNQTNDTTPIPDKNNSNQQDSTSNNSSDNKTTEITEPLPKTGSLFNFNLIIILSLFSLIASAFILNKKIIKTHF